MAKIVMKSGFRTKDQVLFDNFTKEGVVILATQEKLTIFTGKSTVFRHPQVVYKKDETLDCGHWDVLSKTERIKILVKRKVAKDLSRRDWHFIPGAIKQAIYKEEGTNNGLNTDAQGQFNPVSSEETVSDRIKEELAEQTKDGKKEDKAVLPKDEKKTKDETDEMEKNFINFGW